MWVLVNVVIFAAGYGSRFKNSTLNKMDLLTKCLLRLNGETVLGRQLRLLRKHGLTDITVTVPTGFPQEQFKDVKFRVFNTPIGSRETWSIIRVEDLIDETMLLLGDVVFDEEVLVEILNEPFKDIMFVGSDRYYRVWKLEQGKKVGHYPTVESIHGMLTKKGNTERIMFCIDVLGDVGIGNLYRKEKSIIQDAKLLIPKGNIQDIDSVSQWEGVKKHYD